MNRNSEAYFSKIPSRVDMPRSILPRDQEIIFTGNSGDLIPFYVDEVLPGDTHQIDTAKVIRMQTPITPFFGDVFLDTYYFFVPNRLVWDHWQEFCGENSASAWIPSATYTIPQIESPTLNNVSFGWAEGTIADYMGIPINTPDLSISSLPFRAYALICNEFFRDENLTDPLNIPTNDSTVSPTDPTGVSTGYVNGTAQGLLPFKAAKLHDYFTSCLPGPVKTSTPVSINLGVLANQGIPVVGDGNAINFSYGSPSDIPGILIGGSSATLKQGTNTYENTDISIGTNLNSNTTYSNPTAIGLAPENSHIYADTDGISNFTLMTINQLRTAFQVQKYYERLAFGGSRYIEILQSMFGVRSPDQRLQRPEYLGGNRIPISVSQVVQTSATAAGATPQGNVSAFSVTSDYHSDFTKSFVEHGYIIGLCVVRYKHVYQQGIEKMWRRSSKFDFYWPLFSNIGFQPVLNSEIYAQGDQVINAQTLNPYDDEVFGYQEAWAEYRYKPSRVAGEMRSAYSASLDVWHIADDYSSMPALSDDWIREDPANLERISATAVKLADQFLFDVLVKNKTTRPMPVFSIPGLVDHH